jgi:hypothetical protein
MVAIATASWGPAIIQRKQLCNPEVGPILEADIGNHLEWKYTDDHSLTYKVYWAQWKSLAVRDCILKRHWKYTDG